MIMFFVCKKPNHCSPLVEPAALLATRDEADLFCAECGPELTYVPIEAPLAAGKELKEFNWPRCDCCGVPMMFDPADRTYIGKDGKRTPEADFIGGVK